MILFVIFIIGLNTNMAVAEYQKLKFEKDPLTSGLDGIECAIENYDKKISRGVKVDSKTGTCNNLSESWFANQTREDNSTYYKIWMTETSLVSKKNVGTGFPYHWHNRIGSSFVLYGQLMANVGVNEELVFNIYYNGGICYHVNVKFSKGRIVFNSESQGVWGAGFSKIHPFTTTTTYKIEIRVSADSYDFYLDDADTPLQVFPHRVDMALCDNMYIFTNADNLFIEKLQFYYPV